MGNWTLSQESPYLIFKLFRLFYIEQSRKNKWTKTQQTFFFSSFSCHFQFRTRVSGRLFFFFLGEKKSSAAICLIFHVLWELKKIDSSWKLGFEEIIVFLLVECWMMWNFAINWKAISSEKQLLVQKFPQVPFECKSSECLYKNSVHFKVHSYFFTSLNKAMQRLNFKCLFKCFAAEEPLRPWWQKALLWWFQTWRQEANCTCGILRRTEDNTGFFGKYKSGLFLGF